jgi:serine/threonine protein kinase
MPSTIDIPADDQEFLDWAFDQAIQCFEEGQSVSVDDLLHGRESLRAQIEDLVLTARQVAVGAPPVQPAPKIGGFTILNEIGHGGMGTVYLARQEALGGRLVALKVLPWSFAAAARSLDRFRDEANAIARLHHPHIVAVHDIVHDGETHAFAMEWVEGSSLARLIDHLQELTTSATTTHLDDARIAAVKAHLNAPPEALREVTWPAYIIRVGIAIARALQLVHEAGLLHRDVKPANVLIRRDGTPLLSDFGLVRETDATVTNVGSFAGTAAYAAPEQLRGDATGVDRRADVYSLGVTLYHALTLRLPFAGHSATSLLRQIEGGAAPPLRKINRRLPVDLQTIIAKAMEPEPARRYQTADDLADDLQRVLNLQPIKARPAGLVTRSLKLLRRNRRAVIGAGVGGALTLSIIALLLSYFIGFPAWSKEHLDEARLALIDPSQGDSLFSAIFWNQDNPSGDPISHAAAEDALHEYDAAIRFAPFDGDVRLERELVQLARDITTRPMPMDASFGHARELPLTASFANSVHTGWSNLTAPRNKPEFTDHQLQTASLDDLRSLGLLALLCGESKSAMAAWAALDLRTSPDALVEACFGMAYLIGEEYGRAYPRLRRAVEAFPNVGFLTVYLAEAATKCGDLDKAQRWLDQARTMPRLDRFNGLKRVQAGLYAAAGHDALARQLYEELLAENQNIVAFDQYAQFLEAHGELEQALLLYMRIVSHGTMHVDMYRRLIDATERWWDGLDEGDRRQLIQANEPWTNYRIDRNGILPTYAKCIRDLGGQPPSGGIPNSPKADGPSH